MLKVKYVQVSLAKVSVCTSDIHIEVALQGRGVYNFFFLETFFVLNILLERYLVYFNLQVPKMLEEFVEAH